MKPTRQQTMGEKVEIKHFLKQNKLDFFLNGKRTTSEVAHKSILREHIAYTTDRQNKNSRKQSKVVATTS